MALNYSGAGMGALSGAGSGALLGSFFPGVGNALGAGIGAGVGGLAGLFGGGTQGGPRQANNFNPQQKNSQQQILQQLMGMLQNQQNPQNRYEGFQGLEDQYRKNFAENTVPGLAERFTQAGGQRSSAFQGAIGRAGSDLNTGLAALKSNYGMQNQGLLNQQLQQLLQFGFKPEFTNYLEESDPGFGASSLQILLKNLPKLLQAYQSNQQFQAGQNAGGMR